MTEQPEQFHLNSNDSEQRSLVLTIDYNTFLALGFDGYNAEDLRESIRQWIQEGKITVSHY